MISREEVVNKVAGPDDGQAKLQEWELAQAVGRSGQRNRNA